MLTHRRIQAPRPSIEAITTALIAASDEDARRLNEQELGDTLMLLITAVHETTAHLLDQAITALLTHPQVCGDVLAGDMRLATAVDKQKLVAQHRRQRAPGIAGVSQVAAADRPPGQDGQTFAEHDPGHDAHRGGNDGEYDRGRAGSYMFDAD
ncbi:hypothetical protein [Nocardia gipuzkoensis]